MTTLPSKGKRGPYRQPRPVRDRRPTPRPAKGGKGKR